MTSGSASVNTFSLLDTGTPPVKKQRKQNKRVAESVSLTDECFPSLPKPTTKDLNIGSHPRYIVIKSLDSDKPLRNYNQFRIRKAVDGISQRFTQAKFLHDGSLLLLVDNRNIANQFLKVNNLDGIGVKADLHSTLNSVKGTAFCPELKSMSQEELLEGFRPQGITEVFQITRPDSISPNKRVPTGLLILTFDAFKPPKEIKGPWQLIPIREYYPSPMRCKKCQKLGHTAKWCNETHETCGTCGMEGPHATTACSRKFCVNCNVESHESYSRECPEFTKQKDILKIKTIRKCSMYEARREYWANKKPQEGPTYASITTVSASVFQPSAPPTFASQQISNATAKPTSPVFKKAQSKISPFNFNVIPIQENSNNNNKSKPYELSAKLNSLTHSKKATEALEIPVSGLQGPSVSESTALSGLPQKPLEPKTKQKNITKIKKPKNNSSSSTLDIDLSAPSSEGEEMN